MAYSPDQIDKIMREVCGRIAAGQTLREICEPDEKTGVRANPHLPRKSTIMRWTNSSGKEFEAIRDRYARAITARGAAWAEEVVDVGRRSTATTAHADRVKIAALQWGAARADPKKFGDRQQISLDADIRSTKAEDRAPEWMRDRLADETPGKAIGAALDAAVQGKPKGATTH